MYSCFFVLYGDVNRMLVFSHFVDKCTSVTIQSGIARLVTAKTFAAKNRAPDIIDSLSMADPPYPTQGEFILIVFYF